jgi:hypothetical protein
MALWLQNAAISLAAAGFVIPARLCALAPGQGNTSPRLFISKRCIAQKTVDIYFRKKSLFELKNSLFFILLFFINYDWKRKTITKFYDAFADGDASKCALVTILILNLEINLRFLKRMMYVAWKMLMAKSNGNVKIKFSSKANDYQGSAVWEATYNFSKIIEVINRIRAEFFLKMV